MPKHRWKFKAAKQAAGRNNFLTSLPNHHVLFARRSGHLVVSFDNKQQDKRNGQIYPWAFDFLKKGEFSHMGVMVNEKNDWFRDPALFDYFDDLRDRGFFQDFETVTFFGSSMGGFGALSFAEAASNAHALVYSPQSSLDKAVVPWEGRYDNAWARGNWVDPRYRDAAKPMKKIKHADIFYDPLHLLDRRHAMRLKGPNVNLHSCYFTGHNTGRILTLMPEFSRYIQSLLRHEKPNIAFKEQWRERHHSQSYVRLLLDQALEAKRPKRAIRILDAVADKHPEWKFPIYWKDINALQKQAA